MFASPAFAQAAGTAAGPGTGAAGLLGIAPYIAIFAIFYFLMIRPQQQRAKAHRAMIDAVKKGDEVVTGGGVVGKISKVGESYITLEVGRANDSPIEIHVQKAAVQTLLPNGTMKAI
jgi:preprotein translocase subunit YajC